MSDRQRLILQAAVRMIARRGVRGLRVEELAAEAGVSTALIYYHFDGRAGLMRRTLEYIAQRADRYTGGALERSDDPRTQVAEMLGLELQDEESVRENSTAWGELRATAIFDPELQEQLAEATAQWVKDIAELVADAQAAGSAAREVEPEAVAERLTSLVEGLSMRWLSGSLALERAQDLLTEAIGRELGPAR